MTIAGIVLLAGAAPFVASLLWTARAYRVAAQARGARRDACPFENDDDAARPFVREMVDVVRESAARVRAHLSLATAAWRRMDALAGRGPIVLLLPDDGVGAASMTAFGRRLARDLDASVHVETAGGRAIAARADRVVTQVETLAAAARGRIVLLIGHGRGGLVARRAAGVLTLPGLRVLTLATPHRASLDDDARDAVVDRVEVVNVYSLHDASIVPAGRAYLPGAYNVALRDVGHFGLLFDAKPYVVACESLTGLAAHAAAS